MPRHARSTWVLGVMLTTTPLGCGARGRSSDPALTSTAGSEPAMARGPVAAEAPGARERHPRNERKEGDELIGSRAPEWSGAQWIQGGPLTLEGLRGHVVLVRWWTAPDCPLCAGTAPSLNEFHARYRDQGLVVVGFYHHKSEAKLRVEDVVGYKAKFGFEFPVAIDPEWKTLRAYWLGGHERGYTSVSFLIDRSGVIRYIHPGGRYAPGEPAYDEVKATIEALLAEPPAP